MFLSQIQDTPPLYLKQSIKRKNTFAGASKYSDIVASTYNIHVFTNFSWFLPRFALCSPCFSKAFLEQRGKLQQKQNQRKVREKEIAEKVPGINNQMRQKQPQLNF